jgi:sortase (surface protein transpeptidase)
VESKVSPPSPPPPLLAAAPGTSPAAAAIARTRALARKHGRSATLVLAVLLIVAGVVIYAVQLATPLGGGAPNISEIPGSVSNLIDSINPLGPRQESGYPRIKIDKVGIDLRIVKGDGGINPPVKYEAFTYPGADHILVPSPGGGNSYLYAHARVGMFWNLHNLHIGDLITIDFGNNKTIHYRVSELHTKVDWRDLEWTRPTATDRLTLQTCNGWRDEDPRFIVVALRVGSPTALAQ